MDDGSTKHYYSKVEEIELERTKTKIQKLIQEGFDDEILSKEEFNAMLADDIDAPKFYCIFEVHKRHESMTAPPPRPIVGCSGSITENIGAYQRYSKRASFLSSRHP